MTAVDTALREPLTFKKWVEGQGEYEPIIKLIEDAPDKYDFKTYVALIPDEHLDLYLRAEAEWKTDAAAHKSTKHALGLDKPSPEAAIIKLQPNCVFRFRSGRMCGREVVPGVDRCTKHGGALIDPEVRRNILLSAYANIVEGSQKAVDALLDVAENGRSEMARVQAAKELLDRAGLTADVNVNVRISAEVDAGAILRERLETMSTKIETVEVEVIEVEGVDVEPVAGTVGS